MYLELEPLSSNKTGLEDPLKTIEILLSPKAFNPSSR